MSITAASAPIEELDSRILREFAPAVVDLLTELSSRGKMKIRCQTERSIKSQDNSICITRSCDDHSRAKGGKIVGLGILTILGVLTKRVMHIHDVVVRRSDRGCGVGRSIIERTMGRAKELGCDGIDLTSSPERTVAHNLDSSLDVEARNTTAFRLNIARLSQIRVPECIAYA
jgi:hypothetical protein